MDWPSTTPHPPDKLAHGVHSDHSDTTQSRFPLLAEGVMLLAAVTTLELLGNAPLDVLLGVTDAIGLVVADDTIGLGVAVCDGTAPADNDTEFEFEATGVPDTVRLYEILFVTLLVTVGVGVTVGLAVGHTTEGISISHKNGIEGEFASPTWYDAAMQYDPEPLQQQQTTAAAAK